LQGDWREHCYKFCPYCGGKLIAITNTQEKRTMKDKELINGMVRQGDVLVVPSKNATGDEQKRDADGSLTLARGEVTGHRHRFIGDGVALLDSPKVKVRHLTVVAPIALLHEEHKEIRVSPGRYDLPSQYEYTPSELTRVAD